MAATVDILALGTVTLDRAFLVRGRAPGTLITVPVYGFLIGAAGDRPILVDTGYRDVTVLERIGLRGETPEGWGLAPQLALHGLNLGDIGLILQTHLHCDHAGGLDRFPATTPVVVNRPELEFAVTGRQGSFYAREDLQHVLDRVYLPGALTLLDLDRSGPVEVAPGVTCEHAGGHTPGMMFVRVATADGTATICGDVIYDLEDQVIAPQGPGSIWEPAVSNNFAVSLEEEQAAIRRALRGSHVILPSHCSGGRLEEGRVVSRLDAPPVPV